MTDDKKSSMHHEKNVEYATESVEHYPFRIFVTDCVVSNKITALHEPFVLFDTRFYRYSQCYSHRGDEKNRV